MGGELTESPKMVPLVSYCGWTKSYTKIETMELKPLFVGIYKGIESFQGLLGGATWISQPSTVGLGGAPRNRV